MRKKQLTEFVEIINKINSNHGRFQLLSNDKTRWIDKNFNNSEDEDLLSYYRFNLDQLRVKPAKKRVDLELLDFDDIVFIRHPDYKDIVYRIMITEKVGVWIIKRDKSFDCHTWSELRKFCWEMKKDGKWVSCSREVEE